MIIRFGIALVVAMLTVAGLSLVWYKFTPLPRPEPLTAVHDGLVQTPVGQQIATVLGVTDDAYTTPVNVASVASQMTQGVVGAVEGYARHVVTTQAIRELTRQYDQLSVEEKQQIQSAICQPSP